MRDYQIGDWVIYIDKKLNDHWKTWKGISLYGKIAKIVDIRKYNIYTLEFKEFINSEHNGYGKGKNGHCYLCIKTQFMSLEHLKLKKLLNK